MLDDATEARPDPSLVRPSRTRHTGTMIAALPTLPYAWFPELASRLAARMATEPEARDGAHDLSHSLRVARLAHLLAREEGADGEVAVAAALLHDLVWVPKNHPDSPRTAALAAEAAPALCRGLLDEKSPAIAAAILTHSFSGGGVAETLEARIVQDADRLEALGAIGIARVFATGASFGAGLWHPEDPWAQGRDLDDKAWSLDHFPKKLLKLADGMNTEAGRRRAGDRQQLLLGFLEALKEELA